MIILPNLDKAIKIARHSDVKRGKVSCIAFNNRGKIIAIANNRTIHGYVNKWTIHAEAAIIKKLDKINAFRRYNRIVLLVIRVNTTGITIAKPCNNCQELLSKYPVSVMYSDRNGCICRL